jgi:hypothetical protein
MQRSFELHREQIADGACPERFARLTWIDLY